MEGLPKIERADITSLIGNESAFPVLRHWDFFNHAGVSPLCGAAADAMKKYADQAQTTVYLDTEWYRDVERLRVMLATMMNAESRDEIAFVKNTGEGISIVARGIDWKAGDVIVTTAVEYPANVYPWMDVERTHGAKLVMVPEETRDDGSRFISVEKILEAASDPKCRLVALSHVEYASGQRLDIARVGEFCRGNGKLFCVDAIQSLSVLPLDVQAMHIDFLSADGHKWMMGPEGAGVFYIRRELIDQVRPLSIGWLSVVDAMNYGSYDYTLKPDAGRYECGTWNIPGLLGFKAAVEMLLSLGTDQIAPRLKQLGDRLIDGLRPKGYTIISPRDDGSWSGAVSFTTAMHDQKEIVRVLRKQNKIEIAHREGRLRASPHFYNTEAQIDRLIAELPAANG